MTNNSKDDVWPERIRAISAGLKDLLVIAASMFSIYLQTHVSSQQDTISAKVDTAERRQVAIEAKVDTAATVAAEVKKDLKAASSAAKEPEPQE